MTDISKEAVERLALSLEIADQPATAATLRALLAQNEALMGAVKGFLFWADKKCPCENEEPDPCPLCGASVDNLEPCKAADNTLPRDLLAKALSAIGRHS